MTTKNKIMFDLSNDGLRCVLKPYQVEIMRYLWSDNEPRMSREVFDHLHAQGGEIVRSRGSIINFMNDMVDERFLDYIEKTGRGGYRRVYSLTNLARTEGAFMDEIGDRISTKMRDYREMVVENRRKR